MQERGAAVERRQFATRARHKACALPPRPQSPATPPAPHHPAAAMDGEPGELARVPRAGRRLLVSWGPGNELHTLDLVDSGSREESAAAVVQWCARAGR